MTFTAFQQHRKVSTGTRNHIINFLRKADDNAGLLVFEDATGQQVDLDLRESPPEATEQEVRGRGRPKLGVVAREVTLLPRHWDWLNLQPGGASIALRKLVEAARRTSGDHDRIRVAQESAYRFMSATAGNLPKFEEAARALFAYDRRKFADLVADWPEDVRDYAVQLAFSDQQVAV
ncbi:MAG: DUF2239 family protein [Acidobacteriota bacterium]